jgi:hypothetical protein
VRQRNSWIRSIAHAEKWQRKKRRLVGQAFDLAEEAGHEDPTARPLPDALKAACQRIVDFYQQSGCPNEAAKWQERM